MSKYECIKCNKVFTRKQNYLYHVNNNNRPCSSNSSIQNSFSSNFPPESSNLPPESSNFPPESSNSIESKNENNSNNLNNLLFENINKLININKDHKVSNTCIYCDTIFTRNDNLLRHQRERCKSKLIMMNLKNLRKN
jgi:hypothetical protein